MSLPLLFFTGAVPVKNTPGFTATAVGECSPKRDAKPPSTVPVTVYWSDYINMAGSAAPITPVSINLQGGVQSSGAPFDALRSIKIDNINCPQPVTVFFPDTQDAVTCAAFSQTRSNVLTGGWECIVYAPLDTGNLGKQCTIFFNNFNVDTADLQEKTAVVSYEFATGAPFSINAQRPRSLGDRWRRYTLNLALTGVASRVSLFDGPPDGYNFVVLNEIHFRLRGNYVAGAVPVSMNAQLIDDIGTTLQNWSWYSRNDLLEYTGSTQILEVSNQQSIFSSYVGVATFRKWFLQNNVAGIGVADVDLSYTMVNIVNF